MHQERSLWTNVATRCRRDRYERHLRVPCLLHWSSQEYIFHSVPSWSIFGIPLSTYVHINKESFVQLDPSTSSLRLPNSNLVLLEAPTDPEVGVSTAVLAVMMTDVSWYFYTGHSTAGITIRHSHQKKLTPNGPQKVETSTYLQMEGKKNAYRQ